MKHRALPLLALGLTVAASSVAATPRAMSRNHVTASEWTIGPIIDGRQYSRGMPLRPVPHPGGGWHIDLPPPPGSVNYVTFHAGSLSGKRRIVMRYRIELAPGARIMPRKAPGAPTMLTLYVQRRGDDWSAQGPYEAYRWFASFAMHTPITAGDHVLIAPFDGNWTAVQDSTARTNPAGFRAALINADQVGFVLGGGDGLGHGVNALGGARLIVTSFRIE
jgi:hypothetical protein